MNSMGPSKKVHIKRNFTLTVARRMGVIIPADIKVVHIKRYFALNVFILTRFHCMLSLRQECSCFLHTSALSLCHGRAKDCGQQKQSSYPMRGRVREIIKCRVHQNLSQT